MAAVIPIGLFEILEKEVGREVAIKGARFISIQLIQLLILRKRQKDYPYRTEKAGTKIR